MSFLDLDERLLAVAEKADLVYSPLKNFLPTSTSRSSRVPSPRKKTCTRFR